MGGIYDPNGDRMVALNSSNGNPWSLRFSVRGQLGVTPRGPEGASSVVISALRPNPAGGPFTLELSLPTRAAATAEVFDVRGRRVFREAIAPMSPGNQRVGVALPPKLEPGVYFVRIAQDKNAATARIAIIR